MSLKVQIDEIKSRVSKITLDGRLDTHTSPLLEQQLAPLLNSPVTMIVFDMSNLTYISSAGLRVLFKARKTLDAKHGKTFMVNLQPQVQKVFDIVKAMPSVSIFRSYEEMDEYLDYMQRKETE
jgi:anti-sigma B factor antagonist